LSSTKKNGFLPTFADLGWGKAEGKKEGERELLPSRQNILYLWADTKSGLTTFSAIH
jgi:hypothetical protein